jgi:predicted nucleic acid-binding protein
MDKSFYFDASALIKRYAPERGTPVINYLFQRVPPYRMMCLNLVTVEVISAFVRKKNASRITVGAFNQAFADYRKEILDAAAFSKIPTTDGLVRGAIPLIIRYSINSTDAIILRSTLDLAIQYRAIGDDLVLLSSDQRLLRAAQAESLLTFDPETQDQTGLDALLGP